MSRVLPAQSAGHASAGSRFARWQADVRELLPLAWPVVIGQLAMLAFNTMDTMMVARHSQADLAAFAVGAAAYITVFIGFMGVLLSVAPLAGQLFGAGRMEAAGDQVHQGIWLALALSVLGCLLLTFPQPFLWLAKATPEVAAKVRGYLLALACSLPAALIFTVVRGFNTAVSRPKAVMLLQVGGLALKLPVTALLVFGVPSLGLAPLGVTGCGIGTATALWAQLLGAWWLMRRDPFYAPFQLWRRGLHAPHWPALKALLRLGVPMGASILVEVTAFSFMALFIARLGTVAVAGHQIAINLVSMLFMVPLALANATSTLVAQRIGAGDLPHARRLGWHGLVLGMLLAALLGGAVFIGRRAVVGLYTADLAVVAAALPLLAWLALFHVVDAMQTIVAYTLRAWRIATAPMVIYACALWGVGLGGGYALAFNLSGTVPESLQGAPGFWTAAFAGLTVASLGLTGFMALVLRRTAS
ncbi:MATE family efflux transporter [Ideonella azotifigens]|uniref:Multidrug-efflux transporter n=1 Tax=Ideonella azotifigens TaxID=513160 RepID=A0ABN1JZ50_9BURK|nr:MATE family efflux transporter [Ideonella azotifigens]MCD2342787.1 MATE family efflux transporter [Ideonella azotifigens]